MITKKITVEMINIDQLHESKNNPRGKVIHDEALKDLVASIKEKGILVPLIVRLVGKGDYEVVAGNRRLTAAEMANLPVLPCQIMELTDEGAAEVAIIENLQRADVHPIDEGEAYRKLHEEGGVSLKDLAIRVGKDIRYVKQRMFLTNLLQDLRNQYRVGRFKDTHAILLARLSEHDQKLAFRAMTQGALSAPDLGDWIKEKLYAPLEHQPWLSNPEAMVAVGPCTSCPPNKDGLFLTASAGACIDTKCWRVKMAKYIDWLRVKNPELVFVSQEYGDTPKGIIARGDYREVKKKDACASAKKAVVVEGPELGEVKLVCFDPQCKTHGYQRSEHSLTSKEIKARKDRAKKEREREVKEYTKFATAIKGKVKWPLSEKALNVLLEYTLSDHGLTSMINIARRLDLKMQKEKRSWGGESNGYKTSFREYFKKAGKNERAQLVFELLLERRDRGAIKGL